MKLLPPNLLLLVYFLPNNKYQNGSLICQLKSILTEDMKLSSWLTCVHLAWHAIEASWRAPLIETCLLALGIKTNQTCRIKKNRPACVGVLFVQYSSPLKRQRLMGRAYILSHHGIQSPKEIYICNIPCCYYIF
jgi:hypothetical protein